MTQKDAYQQKLQAQLNEWKAEIDVFKAKADKADAEARVEYEKQVDRLREQHIVAQAELDKLRISGEDAWDDLKTGVEQARDKLAKAINAAAARFS